MDKECKDIPLRIVVIGFSLLIISYFLLVYQNETEQQQIRDIKIDKTFRYYKESLIFNDLDERFEKFSSGINVGRFE